MKESFNFKVYVYFETKPKLFAAARATFASRKVKLKAALQAEACYFSGAGYGDPVRAALIAEHFLIQLLLPAVMLSSYLGAAHSGIGMFTVPAAHQSTPRQQWAAGSKLA